MNINKDIIYELIEHLDTATIRKLCTSDQKLRQICQEERFQKLTRDKYDEEHVNYLFNKLAYGTIIKYTINPGKHSILISLNEIGEYNAMLNEKTKGNSILLNIKNPSNIKNEPKYLRTNLYHPTKIEIIEVSNYIVKMPTFNENRITYYIEQL